MAVEQRNDQNVLSSSVVPRPPPKINTIIIFDLESTGINGRDNGRTRITEAAFIGLRREHVTEYLEECAKQRRSNDPEQRPNENNPIVGANVPKCYSLLPRVQFKQSFVVSPGRQISDFVVNLTGRKIVLQPQTRLPHHTQFLDRTKQEFPLTNILGITTKLVEGLPEFSTQHANAVLCLLKQTTPPWCLIAHGGSDFDFKLLRAELKNVDAQIPDQLFCFDSIQGIHYVENQWRRAERNGQTAAPVASDDYLDVPVEILAQIAAETEADTEFSPKRIASPPGNLQRTNKILNSPTAPNGQVPELVRTCFVKSPPCLAPKPDNHEEPVAKRALFDNGAVDPLPDVSPDVQLPLAEPKPEPQPQGPVPGPSTATNSTNSARPPAYAKLEMQPTPGTGAYKLQNLYGRLFQNDGTQDSLQFHTAEDDAIALFRIVLQYGHEFFARMDTNARPFSSIKSYWDDRNSL